MIVEFSVKNFRSIKDLQTISFVTTGLKSAKDYTSIDNTNIANEGDMTLFKTLGIYGANASGKSNVVKALSYFIKIITSEASDQSNLRPLCDPFLLQENATGSESFFQLVMIIDDIKYRYGLTVKRNDKVIRNSISAYSRELITSEWLYGKKRKNMSVLFQRSGKEVINNKLPTTNKIPLSLPYEHSLFLAHAAAFDKEGICNKIRNYLKYSIISNLNTGIKTSREFSMSLVIDEYGKKTLINLFSMFDIKYDDIIIDEDSDYIETIDQVFVKKRYSDQRQAIIFAMKDESSGTQKLFDLSGVLLLALFAKDTPHSIFICLDEIDSNFHPALLIKLIQLFNDPKINKKNSQLLFTSHDTNLMSPAIMRRDQFYFTEKSEDESTNLYSLADLRGIRNDADFARQYLAGYYGGVPIFGDYELTDTSYERSMELETK